MSGGVIRFRVLGPLRVGDGTDWSAIPASQQRTLLAMLLLDAGRVVPADRLVAEIWGEQPPRTVSTTLQGYVARLRRQAGVPVEGPRDTRGGGYRLSVADGGLDAGQFE